MQQDLQISNRSLLDLRNWLNQGLKYDLLPVFEMGLRKQLVISDPQMLETDIFLFICFSLKFSS